MFKNYQHILDHLESHQYKWLVTGVAGFIGSNILQKLLMLNQKVIGLDNFSTGYKKNIDEVLQFVGKEKSGNFKLLQGDIRSEEVCRQSIAGVDFVLHQAALGSVPRSILTPIETNSVNVTGFLNILHAAAQEKIKTFVYASSSSVYGDTSSLPKVEHLIGNQLSPYAVSKYANELYANVFSECYGLKTIGLRYFNVFGPRQDPKSLYAAVIPLWIDSLLSKTDVFINGDGKTTRDFCYIENAVQANILSAFSINPSSFNQVYNIAFGEETTLLSLFHIIANSLAVKDVLPKFRGFRAGDIRASLADIQAARSLILYNPEFSVKDGFKQYISYLQRNTL